MPNIWITSDTHFGHENIIKYCDRPFSCAKEMDEKIRDNWNSIVKPQDKVYHLGDVYFNGSYKESPEYWTEFFRSLNGKKRLILGNHDNGKDQVLQKSFQEIYMWRAFGEKRLLLTHVPIHQSSIVERWCDLNVHGHIHNTDSPEGPYKNVCVEKTNYTPINIEDLLDA